MMPYRERVLRQAEMIHLRNAGLSLRLIGQRYGVSGARVAQIAGPATRATTQQLHQQVAKQRMARSAAPDLVRDSVAELLDRAGGPLLASEMLGELETGYGIRFNSPRPFVELAAKIYRTGWFTHYSDGWWFIDRPHKGASL